jgi:hypothetical protein
MSMRGLACLSLDVCDGTKAKSSRLRDVWMNEKTMNAYLCYVAALWDRIIPAGKPQVVYNL